MKTGIAIVLALVGILAFLFLNTPDALTSLFDHQSTLHQIVFNLRIPRLLIVLSIGGSLALLGGTYQILFHNPLAEPYVLGISSAVTLGIAVAETFLRVSSNTFIAQISGFLFALFCVVLLLFVTNRRMSGSMDRVLLFGMALNFVLSSLLFLLLSYVNQQLGSGTLRWLFGQIPWVDYPVTLLLCFSSVFFSVLILLFGRHLDALSLGDSVATSLGYHPQSTRLLLLLITSIFLSVIVSFTGSIGFVGLVTPHAVRIVFSPQSTRRLLLLSFVAGGVFLVWSDVVSRNLLPPIEFPIGVITTVVGGPLFLWLLWKR